MAFSLVWLKDVLLQAGLKVAPPDPNWVNRGSLNRDVGRIFGVVCHHTGTPAKHLNMPTLDYLRFGDADVRPPIANLGLGRDGTYYLIAAGRANHAGTGDWKFIENGQEEPIPNGNANLIGIEAENTGLPNDFPWPAVQMEAYQRGAAAILKHIGRGPELCIGHKEWARNRTEKKKFDPSFDMNEFRSKVAEFMNGTGLPPVLIPPAEPPTQPGGSFGRPTLRRGMIGELTKQVQSKVGVEADGNFGPATEAAVRKFQRERQLVPDGIVGPKTWREFDQTI